MDKTAAARQAAFRQRHGRQIAVALSEAAFLTLQRLSMKNGITQRAILESLLLGEKTGPADANPPTASTEVHKLRNDLARLERDHRKAWDEVHRLEQENFGLAVRLVAEQRKGLD